jgi:hypothetical protein
MWCKEGFVRGRVRFGSEIISLMPVVWPSSFAISNNSRCNNARKQMGRRGVPSLGTRNIRCSIFTSKHNGGR